MSSILFGKKKLRARLVDEKYKVVPAFELAGVTYYMFEDAFEAPTMRQMAALTIYDELNMRCTIDYLRMHTEAMDKVLSEKKISVAYIADLNRFLKERINMIVPEDYVYRLASVIFFDDNESRFSYNYEYNEKKIKIWKAAGGTLDFFSKTPLNKLIPSMNTLGRNLSMFSQIASQVEKTHLKHLSDILLEKV